jgi:FMN phosphatase YigB (HAD superfamily)
MIKAVSFDFWNTFAIPNPKYAEARTELLARFGISKHDYTRTKKYLDKWAEVDGMAITPLTALAMLFHNYTSFPPESLKDLQSELYKLFKKYSPTITDEVLESIDILNTKNIRWGITSNTNFIGGHIIADYITFYMGLYPDVMVFSDIIQYSKPSHHIFNRFHLDLCDRFNSYKRNEILHIGDSFECDYIGAKKFGFDAKLIETPQHILDTIKEINNGL